jgi:tetratricopeptide (TPR) repeat protein
MLQPQVARPGNGENEFGMLIFSWRGTVKRTKVLEHLPGWSKDVFYRLERGIIAPDFDELLPLYRALWLAGASLPPDGPQLFLKYAREKFEQKKTHLDRRTEEQWAELSDDLSLIDHEFRSRDHTPSLPFNPLLMDTSHLIKRESWHEQMKRCLGGPARKKAIVVTGPAGIGKTSELARFAAQVRRANTHRPILCDFRETSRVPGPEEALDVLTGTVFSALGFAQPQVPSVSLDERVTTLLEQAEKAVLPVIMIVDHAECTLSERGRLATCWERFLVKILKYQHRSTLILVTKQWPTWLAGELRFLAEVPVPPLSVEQSTLLLQQLGLKAVPQPLLAQLSEKTGGIPICLEWVVALLTQPLSPGEGERGTPLLPQSAGTTPVHDMAEAVRRLLAEPYLFGGTLAEEIAPLLEQLLANYHLSLEAQELLQTVSLAIVPLARSALDVLHPQWMRIIRELRQASLLASYADRVLVLPSVAAAVVRALSETERGRREEALITAYQAWIGEGSFYENEQGQVVTELVTLQLMHDQLLSAAQTLIRYGWLAFNLGHAVRLARLARAAVEQRESGALDPAAECGKWLLHYFLSPYLGEKINTDARTADYQCLLERIVKGSVAVWPYTELFVVRHLAVHAMNRGRYLDAQALVADCEHRLARFIATDPDLQAAILENWGFLFTSWCEDEEKQGNLEAARSIREQAITVYERSQSLLVQTNCQGPALKAALLKKRLVRVLTNLGFHLSRMGKYEEAIALLRQSVDLKEQGYTEPGSLAASYGDLSQALLGAGLLAEAQHYDVLAWDAIHRLADAGDTLSQENRWNYSVNRGRLFVKLGRLDEAESLLREALENLDQRWEMYRLPALQALEEIEQQRAAETGIALGEPLSSSSL